MDKLLKGIDVSKWQGNINWDKTRKEVDFAIIRAGYGSNTFDVQSENNASMCTFYNIPYGIYWFGYADNVAEAKQEAESCLSFCALHNPNFPVFYDFELDSISREDITKEEVTQIVDTFCSIIEQNNGYVSIYTNPSFQKQYLDPKLFKKYDFWLAKYGTNPQVQLNQFNPANRLRQNMLGLKANLWQFTSKGIVSGIKEYVDLNICYKDYPSIIKSKHLNNFN